MAFSHPISVKVLIWSLTEFPAFSKQNLIVKAHLDQKRYGHGSHGGLGWFRATVACLAAKIVTADMRRELCANFKGDQTTKRSLGSEVNLIGTERFRISATGVLRRTVHQLLEIALRLP